MSLFQQHQEFFNKPIRLTEEEKKDPINVIDEFFTDYRLSEIREINQQSDRICLSTDDPPFHDADQRDRLLAYRASEEKLLEAASILLQNKASFSKPDPPQGSQKEEKISTTEPVDLDELQKRILDL